MTETNWIFAFTISTGHCIQTPSKWFSLTHFEQFFYFSVRRRRRLSYCFFFSLLVVSFFVYLFDVRWQYVQNAQCCLVLAVKNASQTNCHRPHLFIFHLKPNTHTHNSCCSISFICFFFAFFFSLYLSCFFSVFRSLFIFVIWLGACDLFVVE